MHRFFMYMLMIVGGSPLMAEDTFSADPEMYYADSYRDSRGKVSVKLGIPEELPDSELKVGHYWYALPQNTMTQQISDLQMSVPPEETYSDVNGNLIAHWVFDTELDLEIQFVIRSRNVLNEIMSSKAASYDTKSEEYIYYTREQRLTALTPEIRRTASEIQRRVGGHYPYLLAKEAFAWVLDHMAYSRVPELNRDRGVVATLTSRFEHSGRTYYKGDCGSYTFIFNAILRAMGIPSRMVSGGWSIAKNQFHVWSEVLIPGEGWIPVDTSAADVFVYDEGFDWNGLGEKSLGAFPPIEDPYYFFGNIDPYRYVSATGTEIQLAPEVDWDFTEQNLSWFFDQGKAGIMQIGVFNIFLNQDVSLEFSDL